MTNFRYLNTILAYLIRPPWSKMYFLNPFRDWFWKYVQIIDGFYRVFF